MTSPRLRREPTIQSSECVSQRARRAVDDAVQPKSAEIVGHRTGGIAGQRATEQSSHQRTQVTVTETIGQMAKAAQGSEQSVDAWIAKTECRDALAGRRQRRHLQAFEE